MNKTNQRGYKNPLLGKRDTLEADTDNSLTGLGSSLVKNVGNSFRDIGSGVASGILDTFTGDDSFYESPWDNEGYPYLPETKPQSSQKTEKKTIFSHQNIEDRRQIKAIEELIKQIKQEVEAIKQEDRALLSEVKDIEKLTIETMPEKPGIYHVRFLEVVLKILHSVRAKLGESKTWMQALISKKKKRGSLFAARSKEKGTQYSLSQEMQATRSVQ